SASSTSRNFLAAVNPELAVISVGRGNRYGHPSVHTLRRLALSGVPTRRTDRDGTVAIEARADGSWTARSAAEGF
ncbi:MAG TPA: MBL fold metallo-hydrolase, partial [Gemmatimonadota bacterium]|nr:MBL fold metallo-hydrolase [Gemmatimonadota bacterium]